MDNKSFRADGIKDLELIHENVVKDGRFAHLFNMALQFSASYKRLVNELCKRIHQDEIFSTEKSESARTTKSAFLLEKT